MVDPWHLLCLRSGIEIQHALLEDLYPKLESAGSYLRIDSHVTFPAFARIVNDA